MRYRRDGRLDQDGEPAIGCSRLDPKIDVAGGDGHRCATWAFDGRNAGAIPGDDVQMFHMDRDALDVLARANQNRLPAVV